MTNGDDPVWAPLEAAVGDELVGWFMWMYEVRLDDGTALQAYKHRSTRRYLHLDDACRAFGYDDGRYPQFPLAQAIDAVFASWPVLGATRADLELVDDAWDRARVRETGRDGTAAA